MTEPMLTPEDVAALLRVPKATLYAWRHKGVGPRSYRVGKHIRFRQSDVDAWLEAQANEVASA